MLVKWPDTNQAHWGEHLRKWGSWGAARSSPCCSSPRPDGESAPGNVQIILVRSGITLSFLTNTRTGQMQEDTNKTTDKNLVPLDKVNSLVPQRAWPVRVNLKVKLTSVKDLFFLKTWSCPPMFWDMTNSWCMSLGNNFSIVLLSSLSPISRLHTTTTSITKMHLSRKL